MSLSTPTVSLAVVLTDAKVISSTAEDSYILKLKNITKLYNILKLYIVKNLLINQVVLDKVTN